MRQFSILIPIFLYCSASAAFAQDVTQLQTDVNGLKQIVAGQQADLAAKRVKIWRKSLASGLEYGFGDKGIEASMRAGFIQAGKWYRVTAEAFVFGSVSVSVIDGAPQYYSGTTNLDPTKSKTITAISSSDVQTYDRYVSSSALWQAKSNEFNVYFWTEANGDFAGYVSGWSADKTFTLTIEEVDVSVQPWQ